MQNILIFDLSESRCPITLFMRKLDKPFSLARVKRYDIIIIIIILTTTKFSNEMHFIAAAAQTNFFYLKFDCAAADEAFSRSRGKMIFCKLITEKNYEN